MWEKIIIANYDMYSGEIEYNHVHKSANCNLPHSEWHVENYGTYTTVFLWVFENEPNEAEIVAIW